MRLMAVLIAFSLFLYTVHAEGVSAGIAWPGWEISSGEYYDAPGYPLCWLFDGDPSTAWVFHYNLKGPTTFPKNTHGIGELLHLSRGSSSWQRTPVTIDAIGVINGYAKNKAVYYRNNRITRLKVTVTPFRGKVWEKEFTLGETLAMQRLSLPRMQVSNIALEILAVKIGKDDDLAISEISLFNHNKKIPWHLPKRIIARPSGEIVDFEAYYLMDLSGKQVVRKEWRERNFQFFAWQPESANVLLASDKKVYLYNCLNNKILTSHSFPIWISLLGWQNDHQAMIATGDLSDMRKVIWYQLSDHGYKIQIHRGVLNKDHTWPLSVNGS